MYSGPSICISFWVQQITLIEFNFVGDKKLGQDKNFSYFNSEISSLGKEEKGKEFHCFVWDFVQENTTHIFLRKSELVLSTVVKLVNEIFRISFCCIICIFSLKI